MRIVYADQSKPEIIEGMCRWVNPRIGESIDPAHACGISVLCEHGAATVLYTHWTPSIDIFMHIAGVGHWSVPGAYRAFFGYPFQTLGLRRVTVLVEKKNRRSRKLVEGLGFVYEGCARKGARNGDHLILYGMLREECRWLKEPSDEGSSRRAA